MKKELSKKLLIITRKFPPAGGGGVPRLANFASGLQNHGWEVAVITPSVDGKWQDHLKQKSIEKLEIFRIGKFTRAKQRSKFEKIKGRLRFIDPNLDWALQVIKETKAIDIPKYDLILTSGPPHSVHFAGQKISRRENIKWVADFRDQFTLNPNYRTYSPFVKWYNRVFEQRLYDTADRIITNTRTNRRNIFQNFRVDDPAKFVTINNGYDKTELVCDGDPPWIDLPNRKFNYLYLGGLRGPALDELFFGGILNALNRDSNLASDVGIRVVGDSPGLSKSMKLLMDKEIVSLHAPIPAAKIGNVLAHSSGGLSFQGGDDRFKGMITQKFFEYFGAEIPIFIMGHPNGEMGTILRRFNLGVSVNPQSVENVSQAFLKFHEGVKNNDFNYSTCPERLKNQFNRFNQVEKLACVLNTLVS